MFDVRWPWAQGYRLAEHVSAHHAPRAVTEITFRRKQSGSHYGLEWDNIGVAADQATIAVFYEELRGRGVDIARRQVRDEEIDWKEENAIREKEEEFQLHLMRDIFGNPFHPSLVTDQRTPTVVSLAQAAYEDRDLPSGTLRSDRLAVMADALEEAGCVDVEILTHCRSGGPHVRGCWVVDLILGKS